MMGDGTKALSQAPLFWCISKYVAPDGDRLEP